MGIVYAIDKVRVFTAEDRPDYDVYNSWPEFDTVFTGRLYSSKEVAIEDIKAAGFTLKSEKEPDTWFYDGFNRNFAIALKIREMDLIENDDERPTDWV